MSIRLAKPLLTDVEFRSVRKVLRSGNLVQGKNVERFERNLASLLGVKHAVALSSATAALHLTVLGLDLKAADEVIVPDFTFPAPVNVIELAGAKPVFVDIDLKTFNIDPESVEACITKRTKAILVVHQFGRVADMKPIMRIARRYRLKVIEDAACALGARYSGKMAGDLADAACFSFHPRKIITTGEGGAVVTNNSSLAQRVRMLRSHGLVRSRSNHMDLMTPGLNYRMTEMQAAIGVQQLKRLPSLLADRRRICRIYTAELTQGPLLLPEFIQDQHTFQSYIVVFPKSVNRDRIIRSLKLNGIETTIGSYAVHALAYYKKKYPSCGAFPNSERAFASSLALPVPYGMKAADIRRVSRVLTNLCKSCR